MYQKLHPAQPAALGGTLPRPPQHFPPSHPSQARGGQGWDQLGTFSCYTGKVTSNWGLEALRVYGALPWAQPGHALSLHLALGDRGRGLPTPSISGCPEPRGARRRRPSLPGVGGCVELGAGGGQGRSLASRRWEPTGGEQAPIHPHTERPFRAPRRRLQPSRQVLRPEGGHCGGDKGPLVTGSLLGSPGTGRGRWGAELCLPPGPRRRDAVRCSRHWVSVPATAPVNTSSTNSPAQGCIHTRLPSKPCFVPPQGYGMTWGDSPAPCLGAGTRGAGVSPQAWMGSQHHARRL